MGKSGRPRKQNKEQRFSAAKGKKTAHRERIKEILPVCCFITFIQKAKRLREKRFALIMIYMQAAYAGGKKEQ